MELFPGLLNNAKRLITLAVLQSFVVKEIPPGSPLRDLGTGLLFGATTVLVMTVSVPAVAGLEFNARSVVLSVAGLFGGPIAAGVATLMALAYRFHLGRPGVGMGIPVIVTSAGLGVAGYGLQRTGPLDLNWQSLLFFGLLVQLCVMAWWLFLPGDTPRPILAGIGIAQVGQARLLPFSRMDSAITQRSAGTGLGLYLTRKLVTEMLGGRVYVSSRPSEGSNFRLHLPREVKP